MNRRLNILCVLFLALGGVLPAWRAHALTDAQVEKKINDLKLFLYSKQDKQYGGWFVEQYHPKPKKPGDQGGQQDPKKNRNLGGPTAIATLALLISGESSQDPRMVKAINYLRTLDMRGTYALSLKVHVWSYLPDRYLDNLHMDGERLLGGANAKRSTWGYISFREDGKIGNSWDNSTNQYGILGSWQFAKRGGRINPKFWENAATHFFEVQQPLGGWGYKAEDTRITMTCAGLTCLFIVQQELFRDKNKPPKKITESIDRGMENLDKNFKGTAGHGGYGRYGIERVALASGVKYINNRDWFETIGAKIVKAKPSKVVDASFDLMFLSRGRVPVWANKIKLRQGAWKNRPNDIYFLSRHLSKLGEHEVNWQFVELDRPVMDYLPAPVAWLSSDQALELTDKEKTHLKAYLDLGGVLVANQETSSSFEKSVKDLAREMYPDYQWQGVPTSDPLGSLIFQVEGNALPVKVLSNGVRPLIIMPERDWGLTLQKEEDLSKTVPGQVMANLYAMVSDRGNLPNRLVRTFPKNTGNLDAHPKVWIAQAKFGPDNKLGNPEPAAWTPLRNTLGQDANVNLQWASAPLADLGTGKIKTPIGEQTASLLLLAGGQREADYELTDAEKDAIKAFIAGGGTVLVEGVGGRSEFAFNMAKQLTEGFGAGVSRLISVDPIISGANAAAAKSVAKVTYRKFSVVNMVAAISRPRLGAITVDGRPAVIISSEDLSLAALGVRHWGINGYQTDSARQILTNIILTTKR